jgi:hypothetical protein
LILEVVGDKVKMVVMSCKSSGEQTQMNSVRSREDDEVTVFMFRIRSELPFAGFSARIPVWAMAVTDIDL